MKFKAIVYGVATALVGLALAFSGVRYRAGELLDVLGMPAYFWSILGAWKVLVGARTDRAGAPATVWST